VSLPEPVPVALDRDLVLAARRREALRRVQRQRSASRLAAMLRAAAPGPDLSG
jgi:hypothetical protein